MMNLVMQTFGRLVRPLFGTGIGRIPLVVPTYKWIWRNFGQKGIVKTTANGFDILVDGKDWAVAPSLYFAHTWEQSETDIFNLYIKPDMTVLDIGAHVGYFSLLASKLSKRVYAFEPTQDTFCLLAQNIYNNKVRNVVTYNYAVSDRDYDAEIHFDRVSPASNSIYGKGLKTQKIRAVALDSYLPYLVVDFIKMDIEGGEYKAVMGMLEIIKRSTNLMMVTEIYPEGLARSGSSLHEYIHLLQEYFSLCFMNGCYAEYYNIEKAVKKAGSINLLCRRKLV
jgi:FkbM family methyltransferase